MCTDEFKKFLGCGHVVKTEYKCPEFNKRKNKSLTREQCPQYKQIIIEETYKCNKLGEEYCVKPSEVKRKAEEAAKEAEEARKNGSKDVSMDMDEDEKEESHQAPMEAVKGRLLNPKGTKMAWETSDDEEMEMDFAAKPGAKVEKKPEKGLGASRCPPRFGRGRGRGKRN